MMTSLGHRKSFRARGCTEQPERDKKPKRRQCTIRPMLGSVLWSEQILNREECFEKRSRGAFDEIESRCSDAVTNVGSATAAEDGRAGRHGDCRCHHPA